MELADKTSRGRKIEVEFRIRWKFYGLAENMRRVPGFLTKAPGVHSGGLLRILRWPLLFGVYCFGGFCSAPPCSKRPRSSLSGIRLLAVKRLQSGLLPDLVHSHNI